MSWLQEALLESANEAEGLHRWELVLEAAIENEDLSSQPSQKIDVDRLLGEDVKFLVDR